MDTRALLVVFIGSLLLWTESDAYNFRCYSCSMSGGDVDRKCLTDPAAVSTSYPFVNCNKKYCIIIRIEENDPPGKIFSFRRGCEDKVLEGVVVDSARTTYTRKCTANLCNDWDGIAAKPGGSGSGGGSGNGGESGTIITKGEDNGGTATLRLMSASAILCFILLLRCCQ